MQVDEGLHGILPALRAAPAVLWPAVADARLLGLAALAEASLSFGVAESHEGYHTPLRNGVLKDCQEFVSRLLPLFFMSHEKHPQANADQQAHHHPRNP